jgi:repressor LexA
MVTTTPNSAPKLTTRQSAIFQFMVAMLAERGFCPTVREIGAKFGIRSPNGVICHLKALEKKGMIERDHQCARGIRLGANAPQKALVQMAGVVRAGTPVLSEELHEVLDFSDLFGAGMFALRVEGESMRDAGILDGDTVLVRRADSARSGDIVVARADGEQTIKRFERKGGRYWLCPANDTMEPWAPTELEIIGVVDGVIRRMR